MTLPRRVRDDFPLLARRTDVVYLDSAATSQKPRTVLDAMHRFYETSNANVRRGVHRLGEEATEALEQAREAVRRFLRARSSREVVFTRGTTESINLVAQGWLAPRLKPGDEIVATELEHHSNLLPWQRAAAEAGATLKLVPVTASGEVRTTDVERLVGPRTRLVAFSHASNVLGSILPAARIARAARERGAAVLVDAAQSVPHLPVDVQELAGDFVAFSGHKMLGPTGIGVLWARPERLDEMEPMLLGGGMVREVGEDRSTWLDAPWKLEAGTPPIAEAVGLRTAIEYLDSLGMDAVRAHDRELLAYAVERLAAVPGMELHGSAPVEARIGVVSFGVRGAHPHDVAAFLDQRGICVRAGNHCAQPLMRRLGASGTVRASFQVYNVPSEIDALAEALRAARSEVGR
ncbi:MAG TPA: cysteine desulfurase [Myxococcales bacterium]|nr:cysteine desulfurase [Myxococcales bacterium]